LLSRKQENVVIVKDSVTINVVYGERNGITTIKKDEIGYHGLPESRLLGDNGSSICDGHAIVCCSKSYMGSVRSIPYAWRYDSKEFLAFG
jgi:hypothetical protein